MPIIGPLSQETLSVTNAVATLTAATAKGIPPAAASITVSEGSIRYRVDGTAAGADGQLVNPGDPPFELKNRGEVTSFSAIRDGDDNATLDVTFAVDWKP